MLIHIVNQARYKQFLDVLGEPCTPQDPSFLDTVTAKTESECLAEIENIEVMLFTLF